MDTQCSLSKTWKFVDSRLHLPRHGKVRISRHPPGNYGGSLSMIWLLVLSPSTLSMACVQGSYLSASHHLSQFPWQVSTTSHLSFSVNVLFFFTCSSPDCISMVSLAETKSNLFLTRLPTVHKKLINYSCDKSCKKAAQGIEAMLLLSQKTLLKHPSEREDRFGRIGTQPVQISRSPGFL